MKWIVIFRVLQLMSKQIRYIYVYVCVCTHIHTRICICMCLYTHTKMVVMCCGERQQGRDLHSVINEEGAALQF